MELIFNTSRSYPDCFDSYDDYERWRSFALRSGERCTPCDDCDRKYQRRMQAQARCDPDLVAKRFLINPRSEPND